MSNIVEFHLAKNLTLLMKRENVSLTKLAARVNVPKATLHGWISGIVPHDFMAVKRIADFFAVSLDHLCFKEGDECTRHNFIKSQVELPKEIVLGIYKVTLLNDREHDQLP